MSKQKTDMKSRTIPIEKLSALNGLGELGITGVQERLEGISTYEGEVTSALVKASFVTPQYIGAEFEDVHRVGVRIRLSSPPYGYALVLFPRDDANKAAGLMLTDADVDVGSASTDIAQSALTELGAMVANGFMDSWADAFDVEINTGSPMFTNDGLPRIVYNTLEHTDPDLGLYITSKLSLAAHDITVGVYLFPEVETFLEILDRVPQGVVLQ